MLLSEKAKTHEKKKKGVGNCSQRCAEELFYFGMMPGSSGALVQDSSFCTFSCFSGSEKMARMMCWFLSKEFRYWCGHQVWSKTEDEMEFPKLQSRYKHFNLPSPRKKRAPPFPSLEPKSLKTWSCRLFLFKWEESTFLISKYKQAFCLLLTFSAHPPPRLQSHLLPLCDQERLLTLLRIKQIWNQWSWKLFHICLTKDSGSYQE